jgi:hypothetical protein
MPSHKGWFLSRRDLRTQPGVLTPGTDQHSDSPEGARENLLSIGFVLTPLLRQPFCRPFRAVRFFCPYLGLKPQAESYYPFEIGAPDPARGVIRVQRPAPS